MLKEFMVEEFMVEEFLVEKYEFVKSSLKLGVEKSCKQSYFQLLFHCLQQE